MEHAGHRERLRQRYRREGLEGFAPHEVLEFLLTYAIPRVDTNGMAHELIHRFGSLSGVLEAGPEELEQVPGIGPSAAALLSALLPILRMYERERAMPRPRLERRKDLIAFCRSLFLGVNQELFYVLCLDANLNLLACKQVARGTPSEVTVLPRLVVQELIRHNAAGAVLTHNHPSGSEEPSREDVAVTREIQRVLDGMGIALYDHILIAGPHSYSFSAHAWLDRAPAAPEEEARLAADRPQRVTPLREKKK